MYKEEFFYVSKVRLCCPICQKDVLTCFNCNKPFSIGQKMTCTLKIDGIHICEECYNTLEDSITEN